MILGSPKSVIIRISFLPVEQYLEAAVYTKSNYMVIEVLRSVHGLRYYSHAGERRVIRWRERVPIIVSQCRAGEAIDWGGASVQPGDYAILWDGVGMMPGCKV